MKLTSKEKEQIAKEYMIVAEKTARKNSKKFGMDFDEMYSSALEGLAKALDIWDTDKARIITMNIFIVMCMNTYCFNYFIKEYNYHHNIKELSEVDYIDTRLQQYEITAIIQSIIQQLTEKEQYIIQKHYYENYKIKEIAKQLNISPTNVSYILERAQRKLYFYLTKIKSINMINNDLKIS